MKRHNFANVLFNYWVVLLVWQNTRGIIGNRGVIDVAIKGLLFVYLLYNYLIFSKMIKSNVFILTMVLGVSCIIPISQYISFDVILYYLFPVFLFFLTLGCGGKVEISKTELVKTCKKVVFVVGYIVAYAIVFCWDQFRSAFSITYAYGNELRSFLDSNCEYGLYLSFAVVSILLILEYDQGLTTSMKNVYLYLIGLYTINLILTFSRTTIVMYAIMIFFYVIAWKKGRLRNTIACFVMMLLIIIVISPKVNNLIINKIFLEKGDSGRSMLVQLGINIFEESSIYNKLFGSNSTVVMTQIQSNTRLSSFHNAYIQILVTNGIKGVVFLVGVILFSIHDNIKTVIKKPEFRNYPILSIGFVVAAIFYMLTTTGTLFYSSIDSYFLTIMVILLPKYVNNAIRNNNFEM